MAASRPALRAALPGACVALVVALVLVVAGRPVPAAVLVLVSVLSLGLAILAPAASARVSSAIAAIARRVGRGLLKAVAAVLGVVVVVPLWALNVLARVDPLDDGWRSSGSTWRTRPDGRQPDGRVIAPARVGVTEHQSGPAKRWGRIRRAVIVLVVVGAIAAVVTTAASRDGGTSGDAPADLAHASDADLEFVGLPVTSYAHEDEPWIYDHIREVYQQVHVWDPFLGTRMGDFAGRYLAVKDQARVSYQPDDPELTVWYFGGSTMFGIGQRDDHTIPSEIARLAKADGTTVRSVNYGAPGWVNWQETMLLQELLRTEAPPDLIVFYDGANDWTAGQERVEHANLAIDHNWRMSLSDDEAALRDRSFPRIEGQVDASDVVPFVAAQYRRGVAWARRMADAAGVPVLHFWQPSMETKRFAPSDDEVFERTNTDPPPVGERWSTERHDALVRSKTGAIDVSDALDDVDVPVLWDWAHTNELGARTVAEAMYAHLAPEFDELTGSH
jgi:lysophospholipase L1-like esterase